MGISVQQCHARHDHSRRAVTALQRSFFEEGFLQRMELVAAGEALNGGDFPLSNRRDLGDASALGLPINENRASPTLAFSASVLGSGQTQKITQGSKEARLKVCLEAVRTAVY
jgi:hypothetical protein